MKKGRSVALQPPSKSDDADLHLTFQSFRKENIYRMYVSRLPKSSGSMSVQVSLDGSTPSKVPELSQTQMQRLNAKLETAGCGAVDKTLLNEPEAAAWLEIVQQLCSR